MEHHHILRFLFWRGFTSILLVGRQGVKDQNNDLREFSITFRAIF
jgi:hypothetical protein